jgi:hypothetical protein
MCVGGIALSLLFFQGATLLGFSNLPSTAPVLSVAVIAADLTIPMVVWMRARKMAWQPTLEMAATTVLTGVVLIVGYLTGKKAVYRALKRALAREVFAALTGHCELPQYGDLRPTRRAKNITLTTAATALNVWPARVSELELGRRRDDDFADRYRSWLNAA